MQNQFSNRKIVFEVGKMVKNQIVKFNFIFELKMVILLSDFPKNFEWLVLGEKIFFSKTFLHFFIAFNSNNGNMLWPIGIFLFGRKVPIWTTLIRIDTLKIHL